jgi:hypothetical protein
MTPEELDVLEQLVANHKQNAAGADVAYSNANPVPPQANPAAPYQAQAAQYKTQADALDTQAQTPYPQPVGAKQHAVAATQAAMENFGRLGAPGGYYGQEDQRQKDFIAENDKRVAQAKALRGESAQQQQMGQTATYQAGELADRNRNADINQGELDLKNKIANRPVRANETTGSSSQAVDPNTQMPIPGTEVKGPPRPEVPNKLPTKVIDEGNGKFGMWAYDPTEGSLVHRVGDAPAPGAGGAGGAPAVQQYTAPDGTTHVAVVDKKSATGRDVTMQGDTAKTPIQGPAAGNANAKALNTAQVSTSAARNMVASMQDTLARIKSGKSTAIGADDMNLLSQHLAMTFGTVKGARTGRDLIQEHVNARDLGDKMQVIMESVLHGDQLAPGQREEFVHLAQQRYAELLSEQKNLQQDFGTAPDSGNDGFVKPGGALDSVLKGKH